MWWAYFDLPAEHVIGRARARHSTSACGGAFAWGYLHYFVFGGAAATGAGLAVAVDQATGHSELTDLQAGLALTIPVSAYLIAVWILYFRDKSPRALRNYGNPIAVLLILAVERDAAAGTRDRARPRGARGDQHHRPRA